MNTSRWGALAAAQAMLGLTAGEMWVAYMRLSGSLPPQSISMYLEGGAEIPDHDHDIMAQVLNERFTDLGANHPVAYADEAQNR